MKSKSLSSLLAIFFILLHFSLTAQIEFSLYGGALYEPLPSSEVAYEVTFTSQRLLTGSTYERSENTYENTVTYTFESKPGWQLGANMHFGKKTGLGLTTGIRLHYRDFTLNYAANQSLISSTILDTIEYTTPISTGGTQCDRFESIGSPVTPDNGVRHRHLNLQIPLLVNYHIAQGRIRLEAGGFFSTPVYTRLSSLKYIFKVEEEGDETVCYSGAETQHNTSGDGFSNLTFGLQGGITYNILPSLQISVGIQKTMNNVFSEPTNHTINFINLPPVAEVKPTSVYLSVAYAFSEKGVEE